MSGGWQLSTGDLTDFLRPALFIIAALCSAFVLYDSRRRFTRFQSAAWTLATLFIPFVIIPLYFVARIYTRPDENDLKDAEIESGATDVSSDEDELSDEETTEDDGREAGYQEQQAETATRRRIPWRELALPLVYAAVLLALGFAYFLNDWRSFDAHFARAKRAKLRGDRELTVNEYRAALARRSDAHTHKLLGLELLQMERTDEALAELRAAANGDEPDDALLFYEGRALDKLDRRDEAAAAYSRFIESSLCVNEEDDSRCAAARVRLKQP